MSFDEQIETLKKLKELVDMGVLSQDEFDKKKKRNHGTIKVDFRVEKFLFQAVL